MDIIENWNKCVEEFLFDHWNLYLRYQSTSFFSCKVTRDKKRNRSTITNIFTCSQYMTMNSFFRVNFEFASFLLTFFKPLNAILFHCLFFASPVGTWSVACTITTFDHFFLSSNIHFEICENLSIFFLIYFVSLCHLENRSYIFVIFSICTKIAPLEWYECFVLVYRKQK